MFHQPYIDKVRQLDPDNLVRLFPFDERSGASARDISPNGRTGTYNGVSLMDDIQPSGFNAGLYDGINDYTDIISDLNTDWSVADREKGTIMMWLKKDWSQADKQSALHLIADGNNQIQPFTDPAGGTLHLWSNIGGTVQSVGVSVSGTGWHCFVMTWDTTIGAGDFVEGFKDGVSQGTSTGARSNWSGSLAKALLGIDQNLSKWEWDGHIGITAIWKDVLSDADIEQISRI